MVGSGVDLASVGCWVLGIRGWGVRASRGVRAIQVGGVCVPAGGADDSNLGRQVAPACGHRRGSLILPVSCLTQIHFDSTSFRLKCVADMKTTQCTARSRFSPNPYWRSPHFRAEGIAGAMWLLQKEEVRKEGAGAVAREGYATEVSMSHSDNDVVELRAF